MMQRQRVPSTFAYPAHDTPAELTHLHSIAQSSARYLHLAVTGPRREMLRGSTPKPYEATPHSDIMLAGCFGLLHAFADRYPAMAKQIETALL